MGGPIRVAGEASVERRLAAILSGDVVGYSRLMGADEVGTLHALKAIRRELADPAIASHHGRVVKTTGDGILVEFPSVVNAVACAVAIQNGMLARNAGVLEERQIVFRIGINIGDIIIDETDIHGDGVNVAARLEAMAQPGGICISGAAHDQVHGKLDVRFENMGEQSLKNIARPVRAYRVVNQTVRAAISSFGLSTSGQPERPALALPDKPSLAVLPFQNMSSDPEQEYFADGMVEDLITAVSRFRSFFVIARNSSFTYKGKSVDVKQVGRDLGVRYVLEGSVRKAAGRVRITAQLMEAGSGAHLWAERFDRPLEDIFAVQEEITDLIATTLEPEISAAERERARRKPPDNLDAWERYQRGMWHLLRRNREDFAAARALFLQAIEIDPNFSTVHAALAVSYFYHITHGYTVEPENTRDRLLAAASEAVALDPRDPLAHSAMGLAFMECLQTEKSIAEHRTALELNPSSSFGHWAFGYALVRSGRPAEAIEHFDMALRLSPRDPATWTYLTLKAHSLYQLRRYEEAVALARDATRFTVADLVWPYVHWAAALGQLGRIDQAPAVLGELLRRRPGLTVAQFLSWPHNRAAHRPFLDHTAEGLRLAGLLVGEPPALPLPDKPSLAVLPFQNMSGDPEQEYFADGMVEDITTALSRVRSLFVIARNSSFTYKGKSADVKQVGRELGVRYVVEGSVRKAGSRIRITSQLIDTESGRHIWAEKFDRELQEIFDIQDEITLAIAASVQTQVDLHEGDIASRHKPSDLNLWGLLKRAWRRFLDLDNTAIEEALRFIEEALSLDPNNSDAYALKSVAIYHLALMDRGGLDKRDRITRARDIAATAVKLDDKSEFAHWALGNSRSWLGEGDYGLSSYRRALELNPNFSLAYGLMGSALIATGKPAEGIEANMTAIRSNPRDPSIFFRYFDVARGHFALENYEAAVEWAQRSIGTKKGWFSSHLILIAGLAQSGRLSEAKSAVKVYLDEFPGASVSDGMGAASLYRDRLVAGLRLAGLPE
jgi:adenylate cyclase